MQVIFYIFLILGSFLINDKTKSFLRDFEKSSPQIDYEPTYLPQAKYLKLASLGFNNFLSDILWFKTNSYFGEEFSKSNKYQYLDLMCNLTTDLDPKDQIRYENCATLLSWIVKDPKASNKLLDKAIKSEPNHWRYYYSRGFNHWYFFEDMESAKNDFLTAAKIPEAPTFISSLASRLISETSSPKDALVFLKQQYNAASNKQAREALLDKIKRAELSYHMFELDKAANSFLKKFGKEASSFDEIIQNGLLRFLPEEPFGGKYILENNKTKNTSGEKPLKFSGKTAKTGAMRGEFKDLNITNDDKTSKNENIPSKEALDLKP